jgi:integrase
VAATLGLAGNPDSAEQRRPTQGEAGTLTIPREFADWLSAWYDEVVVTRGFDAKGPVWPGPTGKPMSGDSPNRICKAAQVKAGLVDENGKAFLSIHGLRHTCASLLFTRNEADINISLYLGHADKNATNAIYAHLSSPDQLDRIAADFEQILLPPTSADSSPTPGDGAGTLRGTLRQAADQS